MLKVVFFGSSKFVIPIIEAIRKNFDLALVITTEKNPTDPVPSYCIKSKVCYYVVTDFRDKKIISKLKFISKPLASFPRKRESRFPVKLGMTVSKQTLKEFKPDIGVLASFGAIIPNDVLDLFPHGIINIHPSLLPKYRGPTPVQTAILNGDKKTGVSIIKLDEQVDHGPILAQVEEPIFENDTNESLYDRLFRLGSSSIVSTIELYLKGKIKLREQNHAKATFTKRLTREDGFIDLNSPPKPVILNRMIRAYYPWPSVWTHLRQGFGGQAKLKIIKFLPDKKVQVEGRKPVTYKDFINGYPKIGKEILTKLGVIEG